MLTPETRTTQHMNKPEIDPDKYQLKFTGLVNKPPSFRWLN